MAEEIAKSNPEKPKKGKSACLVVFLCVVLLVGLSFGLFFLILHFGGTKNSKSSSATTAKYGGNWVLDMTDTAELTGLQSDLKSNGSGKVNFQMPSAEGEKFETSGDWSSEGQGTVGPSENTTNLNGTVNVSGEIKGGKLHLTVSYTEKTCRTTIMTPIGGSTSENCDPNSVTDPHVIDIDITDGATTTSNFNKSGSGYNLVWTENWKLVSVKLN